MNIFEESVVLSMIDFHLKMAIYYLKSGNNFMSEYHEAQAAKLELSL